MIHRDALLKEEEALAQKERSEIVCPACGVPNDASLEYCLECGAKIAGEAKAETETEKAAETEAETEEAAEVKEEPLPVNIEETETQPEAAEAEGPPAGKEQVCPVCGTKFALDTKVCPNCGVKIL
jgi:DNA-directed RNA polymerase subunit RPC12/RpoP